MGAQPSTTGASSGPQAPITLSPQVPITPSPPVSTSLVGPSSTFQIQGVNVPITSDPSIEESQLQKFLYEYNPFKEWVDRLNHGKRFHIRKLHVQTIDMFGPRIGFVKFKLDVVNEQDKFVPGIVFMRGGAVAVLVILSCEGKEYTVLTVQPRVPLGDFECIELPAGMIDNNGSFVGVAAKELNEETGLTIEPDQLIDLGRLAWEDKFPGLLPSPGGCDEFLKLYLYRTDIDLEKLQSFEGKATGVLEEGEMIKLMVVPLEDLWKITADCKALCSLLLYENLKREGKI